MGWWERKNSWWLPFRRWVWSARVAACGKSHCSNERPAYDPTAPSTYQAAIEARVHSIDRGQVACSNNLRGEAARLDLLTCAVLSPQVPVSIIIGSATGGEGARHSAHLDQLPIRGRSKTARRT